MAGIRAGAGVHVRAGIGPVRPPVLGAGPESLKNP